MMWKPTPKTKRIKSVRPRDAVKHAAFLKVAAYLEANDEEQTTINDLIDLMRQYLIGEDDNEPYSFRHMKSQLMVHYKDNIVVIEINGKSNV